MATSKAMTFPLSLLFLSIILLLAPATKADIALFSSDHSDDNSILTSKHRRNKISNGETLTDGLLNMVVGRDCSIFLYYTVQPFLPCFALPSDLETTDCYVYLNNRGALMVHANDMKTADKVMFGEESDEGRYALVLNRATLAIYGPAIWSNGVGRKQASLRSSFLEKDEQLSPISGSFGNVIYSGNTFEGSENGDVEVAKEGRVTARLRPDCTLAVQKKKSGKVLWSTQTDHALQGQCKLELTSDGQLVIRDYINQEENRYVEVFNSGPKSKDDNSYICLLWVEGELMIYGRKVFIFKQLHQKAAMATV